MLCDNFPIYAIKLLRFSYYSLCGFCVLILNLFIISSAHCQQPVNIGFETGTFIGWNGATGQCCPIYTPQAGIDTARHVITSGIFTDPYSNGIIPVTAPGSLFSARLGNESGSAESEILDYNFTVPSDSMLLILRFAVILENGIHPASKQSRFGYEVSSSWGNLQGCLEETILAGDSTLNFIISGPYEMLDWQTRIIDLTGMAGASISVHFETGDCEPGGHFGYAYVDGELTEAKITGNYCNTDGSITLFAPPGISGTWFNGSTSDSVNIVNPLAGSTYYYEPGIPGDCNITLTKTLNTDFPQSSFTALAGCNYSYTFQNTSLCSPGANFLWDFGDGQSNNQLNTSHIYNGSGTYEVELVVTENNNCISRYNDSILIVENPEAVISIKENCIYKPVLFSASNSTGLNNTYSWFIDNGFVSNSETDSQILYQPGLHTALLIATDFHNCPDTSFTEFTVGDITNCEDEISGPWFPNAFTPDGDGKNDYFKSSDFRNAGSLKMTIYNRFGELIYEGQYWDGKRNGVLCPQGIYCYKSMPVNTEIKTVYTGTVMLLR